PETPIISPFSPLSQQYSLSGYASYGEEIKQSSVNQIQRGETTKQQIINAFGNPDGTYFEVFRQKSLYYRPDQRNHPSQKSPA
ncbi:MAG: hypothetical protein ABIG31_06020, partial [Candidatus Omnitrophota bacterium]